MVLQKAFLFNRSQDHSWQHNKFTLDGMKAITNMRQESTFIADFICVGSHKYYWRLGGSVALPIHHLRRELMVLVPEIPSGTSMPQ